MISGFLKIAAAVALINVSLLSCRAEEQKHKGCGSVEPCRELKLPPEITRGRSTYSQTPDGTLTAINLGHQVDLSWKHQPAQATRILLYRSTSSKGPWKNLLDLKASALEIKAFPDQVDGTSADLYYRLEIWSSDRLLSRYPTLRVLRFRTE